MASTNLARLITFDIDGTLVRSVGDHTNRLHKGAFSYAFKQVFGIEGTIDAIKHHGSTDPLVAIDTLAHYGIPREESTAKVDEIKASMLEYARSNEQQAGEGLIVLPGIENLLTCLSVKKNIATGLVTGNLEPIGWMKMQALGLKHYFSNPNFGGFGSDHTDRAELVRIAARRARELHPEFSDGFGFHVHVGDTPADIRAAVQGGAHALGVCTGVFSRAELEDAAEEYGADTSHGATILDDVSDVQAFLAACKL